jgi:hypothetical protein
MLHVLLHAGELTSVDEHGASARKVPACEQRCPGLATHGRYVKVVKLRGSPNEPAYHQVHSACSRGTVS